MILIISEAPVRSHLKNVYATLTMSIMAASAGAYVHLFTDILKVPQSLLIKTQHFFYSTEKKNASENCNIIRAEA